MPVRFAFDRVPKFSPGREIVFVSDRNGDFDVFLLRGDDFEEEVEVFVASGDTIPVNWSPAALPTLD